MGRYTTVQTYTDQDAKIAAISYSTATANAAVESGARSVSSAAAPATSEKAESKGDDKFHFNRVDNVAGSSAGAGSGEFHMYRASRRREMDRVANMEKEHAARMAQEEFEAKRKRDAEEFAERANKRAEKRRRRKANAKAKPIESNSKASDDAEAGNDATSKKKADTATSESTANEEETIPETPGGVPAIPNDGSFLERMLALKKQKATSS
ncbi:TPA: hypothetical protein N0F65_011593 [Lagenidium giganteum]|uniref:Uncharacterized protein n=1 Tax=Lagenidium giganteum TaxID=4803 RepID=A0AAV2ZAZ3_9STRA|nr:TPA: hypothetical protein N0F65_011593 [Lagenidium giganteum]